MALVRLDVRLSASSAPVRKNIFQIISIDQELVSILATIMARLEEVHYRERENPGVIGVRNAEALVLEAARRCCRYAPAPRRPRRIRCPGSENAKKPTVGSVLPGAFPSTSSATARLAEHVEEGHRKRQEAHTIARVGRSRTSACCLGDEGVGPGCPDPGSPPSTANSFIGPNAGQPFHESCRFRKGHAGIGDALDFVLRDAAPTYSSRRRPWRPARVSEP